MPSFQKLFEKEKDNIQFLFVTTDSIEKVESFKLKHIYTFPVYQGISNPIQEFETSSIPRTIVIDESGKIVIDKSGGADWFNASIQKEFEKIAD